MAALAKGAAAAFGGLAAADAVADRVASLVSKLIKPNKNKKNKNKNKNKNRVGLLPLSGSSSSVNAPLSTGMVYRSRIGHSGAVVPFNTMALKWLVNSGGSPVLENTISGNTSNYGQGLNPTYQGATDSNSLGFAGATLRSLASTFVLWRFKSLVVEWVPVQPATEAGVVVMGYLEDSPSPTNGTTFGLVAGMEVQVMGPVWTPLRLDLTRVVPRGPCDGFFYTDGNQGSSEADLRQECAGSIFVNATGVTPGSGTAKDFGYLRFSGEIEFRDLAPDSAT